MISIVVGLVDVDAVEGLFGADGGSMFWFLFWG